MKKRYKYGLPILIILILVIASGYLFLRRVTPITYEVEEIDSRAHWGKISGSLGFPSEMIPAMGVCAESPDSEDLYCTYEMLEREDYTYGVGYEINVPPGEYQVFSHLVEENKENPGYTNEEKAYYSQFVTCGLLFECPSHKPIKVKVESREHVSRIDPIDWYNF